MRFFGEGLSCVRGERLVFAGLGFAVSPGEAVVLTGRNGSGKTSLLRVMAGLTRPAAGTLAWDDDGPVVDNPERHRARLHYVGHLDAVKPVLSVRENLLSWVKLRGGADRDADAGLARFGLAALAGIPGRYLSAGQRRRLSLARLATPAALWLLDEPTIALDRESVAALLDALAAHRAGGGMAVIATNVALGLADAATIDMAPFAAAVAAE